MPDSKQYQDYGQQLDQEKAEKQIRKTLYISRRAIWANILLSMLISYVAGYIHTRRWKALGIFVASTFAIFFVTASENESFEEGLERGISLSPLFSLIGTIDNSLAIRRARQTIGSANTAEDQ